MKSHITREFRKLFYQLPEKVRQSAKENYKLWKKNPFHPGLGFKKVSEKEEIYSLRIGIGWRAIGVKDDECIIWFWIGSHEDYNKML